MGIEIDATTLTTTVGIAFVTAIIVQFLTKPGLRAYESSPWYPFALNLSATLIAIILSVLGLFIIGDSSSQAAALAIVRGFIAAFAAVFGYEAAGNIKQWTGGK